MASTRSFKNPGIFAEDATTVIPSTPIAGVAYRDAVSGADDTPNGWRYGTRVASQDWNQVMFLLTSMMGMMDRQGVLGWSDQVDYAVPALVFGSDGLLYIALQPSGPATAAQDPVSAPTFWEQFALHGRQVFTSDGTFTVPMSMQLGYVRPFVKVVGGGGGGARNTGIANGAGGGGGGGVAEELVNLSGIASVSVTIGAGGAGATIAGNDGAAGGSSAFGAFCSATGGSGGSATGEGGAGGVGSGGDINYTIGHGGVSTRAAGDADGQGGYGGGGGSPGGSSGATVPVTRGNGGGGRIATAAPDGAAGLVVIEW